MGTPPRLVDVLLGHGPSGNQADPNAANTDESMAKTYNSLPDALILYNGDSVRTASQWEEKRRPEIVELFYREIYGRLPRNIPAIRWELIIGTPADSEKAVPLITEFGFNWTPAQLKPFQMLGLCRVGTLDYSGR